MTVPFLLAKSAISLLKYVAKAMPIKKRSQGPFHPMDSVTYLADFAQKALGTIFFAPSFQALFISCSKVFLLQDFLAPIFLFIQYSIPTSRFLELFHMILEILPRKA